jgi:parvulin-like peptidyl-prolyl isomerase
MRSAAKYIWIFIVIVFVGVFLFTETSGLLGRAPVTTGTAVAKVNGDEIPYTTWVQAAQQRIQQEQEARGRPLSLDEEEQIRNDVFNQLVQSVLLDQEYERRGIRVTDEEIVQARSSTRLRSSCNRPSCRPTGGSTWRSISAS